MAAITHGVQDYHISPEQAATIANDANVAEDGSLYAPTRAAPSARSGRPSLLARLRVKDPEFRARFREALAVVVHRRQRKGLEHLMF